LTVPIPHTVMKLAIGKGIDMHHDPQIAVLVLIGCYVASMVLAYVQTELHIRRQWRDRKANPCDTM
jgi:hypothetical protein